MRQGRGKERRYWLSVGSYRAVAVVRKRERSAIELELNDARPVLSKTICLHS